MNDIYKNIKKRFFFSQHHKDITVNQKYITKTNTEKKYKKHNFCCLICSKTISAGIDAKINRKKSLF